METSILSKGSSLTKKQIADLLSEYESSKESISISEFCQMYDIQESIFHKWRQDQIESAVTGRFVPLSIAADSEAPTLGPFASIRLEVGMEVILHQYVAPSYLQTLLTKATDR